MNLWHVLGRSLAREDLGNRTGLWAEADVIVTQAVSRMRDGTAGSGNWLLACAVRRVKQEVWRRMGRDLPVIPQEEVAMAEPLLPDVAATAGGSPDGRSSIKWNTYTVAKFQAEVCKSRGWKTVIVVTFDLHMPRACMVYESLGLRTVCGPIVSKGYTDRGLIHWGMRTRRRAAVREFVLLQIFRVLLILGILGTKEDDERGNYAVQR